MYLSLVQQFTAWSYTDGNQCYAHRELHSELEVELVCNGWSEYSSTNVSAMRTQHFWRSIRT